MEYEKLFSDHMKAAGFDVENGMDIFKSYYTEYHDSSDFYEKAKRNGLRLDLLAAAVAHLKTSNYLGFSDKAAYDIRSLWGLTDEEYIFVAETLFSNLKRYHLEDSGVPSPEEQQKIDDLDGMPRDLCRLKRLFSITGILLLIVLSVFIISSISNSKIPEYQVADVKITGVYSDIVTDTEYVYINDVPVERKMTRTRYSVFIEDLNSEYYLKGVPRGDLDRLRKVKSDEGSITVYKLDGAYYYTESSMLASRASYRYKYMSLIVMVPLFIVFIVALLLYVIFRKCPERYLKFKEMGRRRSGSGSTLT